ncbi:hypothetical protein [Planococcus beigongshangi]|uniref:hypothetical protein n=1 Tax=Planococcus beigongshangi TaxID=2782536 RepID=UPI00193B41BD|nr:hypothetical protein [Planococcus beigongshangi]
MKKNHISDLLSTICQYNNVRITQTFTQEGNDLISVRCVPDTTTLELTFLETGEIALYNSVEEAAAFIDKHINRIKVI